MYKRSLDIVENKKHFTLLVGSISFALIYCLNRDLQTAAAHPKEFKHYIQSAEDEQTVHPVQPSGLLRGLKKLCKMQY